jgi:hypothetical protein
MRMHLRVNGRLLLLLLLLLLLHRLRANVDRVG